MASLAAMAADDLDAAQVLLDALLEGTAQDERVMMLCLGVPPDVRPPLHIRFREVAARNWRSDRKASIAYAASQNGLYLGRADHARACRAVAIFGSWSLRGTSGSSPWAVCRAADPEYQARLKRRRAARRRSSAATAVAAVG